jgi:3-oxoacyl-[acyl-carrier-protein] synthase-1
LRDRVAIIGAGAFTPVGLSLSETATAVRAGIARVLETSYIGSANEWITMSYLPAEFMPDLGPAVPEAFPELSERQVRMVRMGGAALAEAVSNTAPDTPVPLIVGVPAVGPAAESVADPRLLDALALQSGVAIAVEASSIVSAGRAAGLMAVHQAGQRILSGEVDFAVAGGCDSYQHPELLEALDSESRLLSQSKYDGFVPGEGAGFLLLASRRASERGGAAVLGWLDASGTGFEEEHLSADKPHRGEGLARTLRAMLDGNGGSTAPVETVYASMNGERYWAKEWGVAAVRLASHFSEGLAVEHPADCYGDAGSAAGPLMAGLALAALEQGYRSGPALVYASSDAGERAAIIISAAGEGGR